MLITCGKCGNDVSDKALRCPKCKAPVQPLAIACPECEKDITEADLTGDCPHCGYPLRHLRLSSTFARAASASSATVMGERAAEPFEAKRQAPAPVPPPPPPPPPKTISLECPNCGCVGSAIAGTEASRKCPKCGFLMRVESSRGSHFQRVQSQGAEASSTRNPRTAPRYDRNDAANEKKKREGEKSSLFKRLCVGLLVALLIFSIMAGAGAVALKFDVGGVRSSLKSATATEETDETLSGRLVEFRLWMKYAIGVVLDQFPDNPSSGGAGVDGNGR